jgi:hypothetical protein
LCWLAALSTAALAASPAALPRLIASQYAQVNAEPSARKVATRVAALIDESVPRIAPLVGTRDLRPIPTFVYLDRAEFEAAAPMAAHTPVVGVASYPPGVIHIDGSGRLASIEKVVPHEVAHVMVGRAMGPALPALPTWVNEGVAEYAAGERASQVDPVTLQAVGRGESLPLSELDRSFERGGAGRSLAYAEAASVVNFLVAARGPRVIADLLSVTRRQGDFESAVKQVTGWSNQELESAWRRSVARRWRWPLLLGSPAVPFGLMLLIFIVGYLRYRRERRRRQEMEERDW